MRIYRADAEVCGWSGAVLAMQDVLDGGPGWEDDGGAQPTAVACRCQECGKRFVGVRKSAKYCSKRCRQQAYRNR